jgi:DNA primase
MPDQVLTSPSEACDPGRLATIAAECRQAGLAASALNRYTIAAGAGKRTGRIFIDYLRNGRGTTAIGAWSPRARFPVAAPVSWRQV